MTTRSVLFGAWDWEPSVLIGCIVLTVAYFLIARRLDRRAIPFLAGVTLLLLALVSPLDALGDDYLLSAHVAQHFLLALIVPPLLVLSAPRRLLLPAWLTGALNEPWVGWPLGVGTMLIWHVPVLFNAALSNDAIHIVQHLSFLITGVFFWWPICGPKFATQGNDHRGRDRLSVFRLLGVQSAGRRADVRTGGSVPGLSTSGRQPAYSAIDSRHLGARPEKRSATGRDADVGAGLLRVSDRKSGEDRRLLPLARLFPASRLPQERAA